MNKCLTLFMVPVCGSEITIAITVPVIATVSDITPFTPIVTIQVLTAAVTPTAGLVRSTLPPASFLPTTKVQGSDWFQVTYTTHTLNISGPCRLRTSTWVDDAL